MEPITLQDALTLITGLTTQVNALEAQVVQLTNVLNDVTAFLNSQNAS